MTVRSVLNKIFWDPKERRDEYVVTFIHRGAPLDRKSLSCQLIKEIKSSWLTYESETEGEVVIPFHRILEIKNIKTGETVWMKSKIRGK